MKPSKPYEEVQITPTLIWRWVREGDEYVMRISEMALEAHKAHIEAALAQPEHPDLRKAAELALDALLTCDVDYDYDENPYNTFDAEDVSEAIDALRQALAQPEFDTPESHIVQWSIPVDPNNFGEALAQPEHFLDKKAANARELGLDYEVEPMPKQEELIQFKDGKCSYVRKPWVGLTDDEILSAAKEVPITCVRQRDYNLYFAPIIEAKLREKNNAV